MRRQQLKVLNDAHIAAPCPMRWKDMTGDDQVRHCDVCVKNVYNLSGMTRAEAAKLIQDKDGKLCARYFVRPDGTIITSQCPKVIRDQMTTLRKFAVRATAVLAPLALFSAVFAVPSVRGDENPPAKQIATIVQRVLESLGFSFEEKPQLMGDFMLPPSQRQELTGKIKCPPTHQK